MKYGHFDDYNKEYVITSAKTPSPWINYLGQNDFFSLISNTLGGYSFYRDAKLRRITRYRYNNLPNDVSGRFYYIKDGRKIWNPGYMPCKTKLDSYECRHGLGYTLINSSCNGISSSVLCFVPLHDTCEVNKVVIKNTTDKVKEIELYGCVEFCLWNAIDDSTNFQRNLNIAEVEIDNNTIFHKTEYRERRNHYSFFYTNVEHDGFDSDRDEFLGLQNGFESPSMVIQGKSKNTIAYGGEPIGCHRLHIKLNPGEEKIIIFVLGYCENDENNKFESLNVINKEPARKIIDKYSVVENVDKELQNLKDNWNSILETYQVSTGNEKVNRMVNIWNQYQCMITYCMSRSASYYESGTGRGMGFRDSCQDLLGFVHQIPAKARERIIDIASIQFEDGSTYHQYQPLTKTGNSDIGSGFNDDPLWLIAAVSAYLKETGDYSILDEMVPFDNKKGTEKTLYDHLNISLHYTMNHLGPHRLPLIGRADWNDCLNLNCFSSTPGESFQTVENFENGHAESVFIAGMFVKYGKEFSSLAKKYGKEKDAEEALLAVENMERAVIKDGWDGSWFLRAYDAYDNKIGSKECEDGKIFVEPQGFCVMAGIGKEKGYGKKTLRSVEKYLTNKYGVELLYPPYRRYHLELGEISSYPPGHKENASVFCHNNPWITLAYCEENDGERAFKNYKRNAPSYLEDVSNIHITEPYVYSQTIAGRSSIRYGQARNSWLTGTASWSFVAISQGILGVIPTLDGLLIKPCLPKEMSDVTINRTYRKVKYVIKIYNENTGKTEVSVNKIMVEDGLIPYEYTDKTVFVDVKM